MCAVLKEPGVEGLNPFVFEFVIDSFAGEDETAVVEKVVCGWNSTREASNLSPFRGFTEEDLLGPIGRFSFDDARVNLDA